MSKICLGEKFLPFQSHTRSVTKAENNRFRVLGSYPQPTTLFLKSFHLRLHCYTILSAIWYGERGLRASNAIACKMSQSRRSIFLVWLPCMVTKPNITHLASLFLYSNPKPDTPRWELHVNREPNSEPLLS